MTHRRDIAGALIATFLAIAMGTASGLHFAAYNYGRGIAFLVACLALIVAAAYSGARAMPHPYQPEIDELKDMLDAMDPKKKIEALKAEFVRGDIGIHELEARTLHIHKYGVDPGADELFRALEEQAVWEAGAKAKAELDRRAKQRHVGPSNTGTTITWHEAAADKLDQIAWERDATGTPVRRDEDGHVTWRAIEVDDRGRVTIARREGT